MNNQKPSTSINLDSFELPFMEDDPNSQAWDDEGEPLLDNNQILELFDEAIPSDAKELGSINCEIENWTIWLIRDRYFITPIDDADYDWAIFRISWDDNRGNWQWCGDARISGCKDQKDAARRMLAALFKNWGYDTDDYADLPYRDFLKSI
jgi:hypothetical protein